MNNFLSQQIEELMIDKGKVEHQKQNTEVSRELQPGERLLESPSGHGFRVPVFHRKLETGKRHNI